MHAKMYVLMHKDGNYYCGANLYLGIADLTRDIDAASQMSLDEAESTLIRMKERAEWEIYRVVLGLRLGEKSIRHIKAWKKTQLEKELKELGDIDE